MSVKLYLLTEPNYSDIFPTRLLGDHLGSTEMVADETGEVVSEVR